VGAHENHVDVFLARQAQDFAVGVAHGGHDLGVAVLEQLPVCVVQFLLHPLGIVLAGILPLAGAHVGELKIEAAAGHPQHVQNEELGLPFHFEVEGHLGRVVANGRSRRREQQFFKHGSSP